MFYTFIVNFLRKIKRASQDSPVPGQLWKVDALGVVEILTCSSRYHVKYRLINTNTSYECLMSFFMAAAEPLSADSSYLLTKD